MPPSASVTTATPTPWTIHALESLFFSVAHLLGMLRFCLKYPREIAHRQRDRREDQ